MVWGASDRQTGTERITVVEQLDFFDAAVHIGDRGACAALDLPTHAEVHLHRNHVAVCGRGSPGRWTASRMTPTRLLVIALPDLLAGRRAFTVLWQPDARLALQGVFWSAGG